MSACSRGWFPPPRKYVDTQNFPQSPSLLGVRCLFSWVVSPAAKLCGHAEIYFIAPAQMSEVAVLVGGFPRPRKTSTC